MELKVKRSFRWNSVKTKLIVIMLLVAVIPLTIAILVNYFSTTSKAEKDAKEALLSETNYVRAEVAMTVNNTRVALEALAAAPSTIDFIENGDAATGALVKQHMIEANKSFSDENIIVLSDRSGQMIMRSDDSKLSDIHDREYFQKAASGNPNVSAIIVSKSTNARNICVAVPVRDRSGQKVIGVIHRSYDLNNFHEFLEANTKEAFIIDSEGTLAAHAQYPIYPDDEPMSFKNSPYMTTNKTSDTFVSTAMGEPKLVAYVKEPFSGFTICNAVSVRDITVQARKSANVIIGLGIAMMVAVALLSWKLAEGFTKPILAVDEILSALADGHFVRIDKYTDRSDEFGDMVRNSNSVIDKLDTIVGEIKSSSYTVDKSSSTLSSMANEIASTTETVAEAVQDIAAGATDQALAIQHSAEHTGEITKAVENVSNSAIELNCLAEHMKKASEDSETALNAFHETSLTVTEKIGEIAQRIASTQSAVSDIDRSVAGISDIAAQTNLLSLNASIEAARAGDAGRGFAVVAEEIRVLADNSRTLAEKIKTAMPTLLKESSEAVNAANEIMTSNKEQQKTLEDTLTAVKGMLADIENTVSKVAGISVETGKCVNSNKEVAEAMASLSAISEENAASSETTGASVEELSATVTELAENAKQLKVVAEVLIQNIDFFK